MKEIKGKEMREHALILGRFNLPHIGHIALITRALRESKRVTVALSVSNSNRKAADWTLRIKAFESLLNKDLKGRVNYTTWTNISQLVGFNRCPVYLGADRSDLAQSLLTLAKVDEARLVARVGIESSTLMRENIDKEIGLDRLPLMYVQYIKQIRQIEKENGYDN